MKILVLTKPTFDTTLVRVDTKKNEIINKGVPYHINDHDKYALEIAFNLKQKISNIQIIAVGIGEKESKDAMREAILRGADEVFFIEKLPNIKYEPLIYAYTLYEVVKKINPNLIICGTMSEDYVSSSTHVFLSEILDWPILINVINIIELKNDSILVERKRENYIEIYNLDLPAIICVTSGITTLKTVTPIQLMRIPRDKIKIIEISKFIDGNTFETLGIKPLESKQRKKIFIDGDKNPEEAVKTLIQYLIKENLL